MAIDTLTSMHPLTLDIVRRKPERHVRDLLLLEGMPFRQEPDVLRSILQEPSNDTVLITHRRDRLLFPPRSVIAAFVGHVRHGLFHVLIAAVDERIASGFEEEGDEQCLERMRQLRLIASEFSLELRRLQGIERWERVIAEIEPHEQGVHQLFELMGATIQRADDAGSAFAVWDPSAGAVPQ